MLQINIHTFFFQSPVSYRPLIVGRIGNEYRGPTLAFVWPACRRSFVSRPNGADRQKSTCPPPSPVLRRVLPVEETFKFMLGGSGPRVQQHRTAHWARAFNSFARRRLTGGAFVHWVCSLHGTPTLNQRLDNTRAALTDGYLEALYLSPAADTGRGPAPVPRRVRMIGGRTVTWCTATCTGCRRWYRTRSFPGAASRERTSDCFFRIGR